MMRFLLVLLAAVRLTAQVVDTDELTYGPFTPGPRDNPMTLAVAPQGMLLVWSEIDPGRTQSLIRTGLLGFDGKLVGSIHTIPALHPDQNATAPAVTTNGDGFFIAWLERTPYNFAPRAIAGVLTDATGAPIETPRSLDKSPEAPPSVIWDGLDYKAFDDGRVLFANPQANGWVEWRTRGFWTGPAILTKVYVIDWHLLTYDWIRRGHVEFSGYAGTTPAVLAEGNDLLIVWTTGDGLAAQRVIDGNEGPAFEIQHPVTSRVSPAIAGSLVVFTDGGDIYGSIVTGDAFGPPFPISTGTDWDTLPRVFQVGPARYLVTYVREHGIASTTLAGRFVTVPQ